MRIGAEAFVYPVVRPVAGGDLVGKPFVRGFMQQQPVETVVIDLEIAAVGDDGLVFHAEVRRFDHPVLVVEERVFAEGFAEYRQDFRSLVQPHRARLFFMFRQGPEQDRNLAPVGVAGVGRFDRHERSAIDRDGIGIDRVGHFPARDAAPLGD